MAHLQWILLERVLADHRIDMCSGWLYLRWLCHALEFLTGLEVAISHRGTPDVLQSTVDRRRGG